MVRVLAVASIVLTLPACAVSTPSTFSSFSGREENRPPAVAGYAPAPSASYAAPEPRRNQQASAGSTLGGWWNSVTSGFSASSSEPQPAAAVPGAQGFDPVSAQKLVNAYRVQKGLKPLKLNPKLSDAARKHSEDLAKSDRISHYGADGSDAWERVRKSGYGAKMTAENVGTGQQSVEEVFRGWQKSKDHNANLLLADADEMGIAMVYNPKSQFKTFWTMVVASPRS